ncbi:MAG: hypothetical protein ACYTFF_05630 [Planctomycetota bacterium]|jgi:hypothetical protein
MTAVADIGQPVLDEQAFRQEWSLSVVVRRESGGAPLACEPLAAADLVEARREAWFNGFLRRGRPQVRFEDVTTRLAPVHKEGRCVGIVLEASAAAGGETTFHPFAFTFVAPLAQSVGERLFQDGLLAKGDTFLYELQARPGPATGGPDPESSGALVITTETRPPSWATKRLSPLVAEARSVGDVSSTCFPVFFSESAHDKAEHYARKGAASMPPVESGALLIGRLCACPDSGEMYVAVDDAVEVFDATQQEFALIYTGSTWSQVEALLRSYLARPGGEHTRLVGQSHGHNFGLAGEPCAACPEAEVCGKTNVFVSTEDRRFMRAVFAGQPWALCWIAGANARGESVVKLFTLHRGALLERGYHVVEDRHLRDTH